MVTVNPTIDFEEVPFVTMKLLLKWRAEEAHRCVICESASCSERRENYSPVVFQQALSDVVNNAAAGCCCTMCCASVDDCRFRAAPYDVAATHQRIHAAITNVLDRMALARAGITLIG